MDDNLSNREKSRRTRLAKQARQLILDTVKVESSDATSLMLMYNEFYLQIAFSPLHPLMILYAARAVPNADTTVLKESVNELNLRSVLGSYAINSEVGCFSYRATQWLDVELTQERFLEMLDRCLDEARRGYARLIDARKKHEAKHA